MKAEALIHYKLTLVLRMIDSVTGKLITEKNVRFCIPDGIGPPISKGEGVFLFMNGLRENFTMEVSVYGYEPAKKEIDFKTIDERMPATEIFLIPKDELPRSESMLSLKGTLSGIESIECIPLHNVAVSVKEYDEDNNVLTIFNPHGESFEYARYGIPNDSFTAYDELEAVKELSKQKVELGRAPEYGCYPNQPVMRIIPGQILEGDRFVLRVPRTGNAEYLVCYKQQAVRHYKRVDFHDPSVSGQGGVQWES